LSSLSGPVPEEQRQDNAPFKFVLRPCLVNLPVYRGYLWRPSALEQGTTIFLNHLAASADPHRYHVYRLDDPIRVRDSLLDPAQTRE